MNKFTKILTLGLSLAQLIWETSKQVKSGVNEIKQEVNNGKKPSQAKGKDASAKVQSQEENE